MRMVRCWLTGRRPNFLWTVVPPTRKPSHDLFAAAGDWTRLPQSVVALTEIDEANDPVRSLLAGGTIMSCLSGWLNTPAVIVVVA